MSLGQLIEALKKTNCKKVNFYLRWKKYDNKQKIVDLVSKKPILQFVAIQRADTKEWALPGVSKLIYVSVSYL